MEIERKYRGNTEEIQRKYKGNTEEIQKPICTITDWFIPAPFV